MTMFMFIQNSIFNQKRLTIDGFFKIALNLILNILFILD